jgi:hypothetical protein
MRQKVIAVDSDPSMPVESAEITIVLRNGDTLTLLETNATGSIGNPMDDDALKAKFGTLAAHGCPSIDAGALAGALWAFEQAEDVSPVLRLARPGSSPSIG